MPQTTLDFNAVSYTLIPVDSTDIAFTGIIHEDDFTLDNLATTNSTHEFATIRQGSHNDHDANDDVPLTTFTNPNIRLTQDGGATFDLISMQFDTFDSGSSVTITIVGTKVGGAIVTHMFTTDTVLSLETVTLPAGFTGLTKVEFGSTSNFQFDNIIVSTGGTPFTGTAGDDTLTVTSTDPVNASMLGGNDTVNFGPFLSSDDVVDGGAGLDTLTLGGGGSFTFGLGPVQKITNVEVLTVSGGNFNITMADAFLGAGQGFSVNGSALTAGQTLTFNGAPESNGAFSVTGGAGNDSLTGGALPDTLNGGSGNDSIHGGGGVDDMAGGLGDDAYNVDNSLDIVTEAAGEGNDRVLASVSYTLAAAAEVELLSSANQAGTTAVNFTGNGFNQTIIGNNGANSLDGGGGNDQLRGLAGNDVLDGGAGDDVTVGGPGNDQHVVDSVFDAVLEAAGEGNDRVLALASYTLAAGAEVELLSAANQAATTALDLAGSDFGQIIFGNEGVNSLEGRGGNDTLWGLGGDDVLDGGSGIDTARGGLGNDIYAVDNAGDAIIETAGEGSDRVLATVSYTLGNSAEIELLSAANQAGNAALTLVGNDFANNIQANEGDNILVGGLGNDTLFGLGGVDVLNGGPGNDTMIGGAGGDSYIFNAAIAAGHIDTIIGFVSGSDHILLDDSIFSALATGALPSGAFRSGAAALDADDRIIYDPATGALYYDPDGNGAAVAQIQFAQLQGAPALASTDFVVI
jgi:Ca2+-binding RTX toxin-like protein